MSSDQEGDVNEYSEEDTFMSVDNVRGYNWLEHQDGDFYRDKRARRGLAMCCCRLGFSLNTPSAIEFFNILNPNFTFREDVVNADCLRVYKEAKDRVKQILGHVDGEIHLSLEVVAYGDPLVKVHFVDENWNLKVWILRFGCGDEDEDTIEGSITSSLSDFGLWNKVSTLTFKPFWLHDDVFNDIKKRVEEKYQLPLNGKLFHVHCCADLFTTMVEGAFKEIQNITKKVNELVYGGYTSYSWDHTYRFLTDGLKFESEGKFNENIYDDYEKLTADEWKKVEDICKIVGYVHKVAKILFETKNPTANIYLHHFHSLRKNLAEEAISSDGFRSSVAKKMMVKFDEYWKDMFMVLAIAAVMDPRLKMKGIEFVCLNNVSTECNYEASTVLEALQNLYDGYKRTCKSETVESASDSCDSDEESFTRNKKKNKQCALEDMELLNEYIKFTLSTSQPMKEDLDLYLEEPLVPWSQEFDVLKWWKYEHPKYPTLSKVARGILALPISLLRSYHAFRTIERELGPASPEIESGSGSQESDLRNAFMCTRSWFKDRRFHS